MDLDARCQKLLLKVVLKEPHPIPFLKKGGHTPHRILGHFGHELVRQLLEEYQVRELITLDNNESELFFQEQRFSGHSNASFCELSPSERRRTRN